MMISFLQHEDLHLHFILHPDEAVVTEHRRQQTEAEGRGFLTTVAALLSSPENRTAADQQAITDRIQSLVAANREAAEVRRGMGRKAETREKCLLMSINRFFLSHSLYLSIYLSLALSVFVSSQHGGRKCLYNFFLQLYKTSYHPIHELKSLVIVLWVCFQMKWRTNYGSEMRECVIFVLFFESC